MTEFLYLKGCQFAYSSIQVPRNNLEPIMVSVTSLQIRGKTTMIFPYAMDEELGAGRNFILPFP